ncbi:Hydantoinaseoxoprolinase, partial [Caulochytrium protostelioides]
MARNLTFCLDRGGTFLDGLVFEDATERGVIKILSVDPKNYPDAPTEGIRRLLELATGESHPRGQPIDTRRIKAIRMGTTVATNALLERKGERHALLVTKGFRDLL